MNTNAITHIIRSSIQVKQVVLDSPALLEVIRKVSEVVRDCFKNGGKVLFCGNGGSAADAQHLSTELSGRFYLDRPPLFAEALHVNTSHLTAVANDYGYAKVFQRLVEAKGKKGDVLIALSTSGNSENVVLAMQEARQQEMITVALTGKTGGKMKAFADHLINVPATDTPRIQEAHLLIGHIICELVERELFGGEV